MKPILFLGGAPKAGTSYCFDLLAQHPNICPSEPKETFYFVDRTYPLAHPTQNYFKRGNSAFQSYFTPDTSTQFLLEGSTHLLYQKDCIAAIQKLDAQVCFILREPARRILSAFEYTKNTGALLREEVHFERYAAALLSDNEAEIDSWVRKDVRYHFLYKELDFSKYAKHLKAWINALGEERIHIIQFEKLIENPVSSAQQLFELVGLPPYIVDTNVGQHSTYQIQHKLLHYYIRKWNALVPKTRLRNQVRDWYFKVQKKPIEQQENTDVALQKLKDYYKPYNSALLEISNLDLAKW